MKILHICNDFAGSKVHVNLTKQLDGMGVNQVVYCPVRDKQNVGKISLMPNLRISYIVIALSHGISMSIITRHLNYTKI